MPWEKQPTQRSPKGNPVKRFEPDPQTRAYIPHLSTARAEHSSMRLRRDIIWTQTRHGYVAFVKHLFFMYHPIYTTLHICLHFFFCYDSQLVYMSTDIQCDVLFTIIWMRLYEECFVYEIVMDVHNSLSNVLYELH